MLGGGSPCVCAAVEIYCKILKLKVFPDYIFARDNDMRNFRFRDAVSCGNNFVLWQNFSDIPFFLYHATVYKTT